MTTAEPFAGFETFYASAHPRVLGVIVSATGSVETARDATDEAFARAALHWRRVQAMASPVGWTCRVGLNVARRRFRNVLREQRAQEAAVGSGVDEGTLPLLWVEILDELRVLTPRQRSVLALTSLAGLTQHEVAGVLGISRSTVASTLADVRDRLAERPSPPACRGKEPR